LTRLHVPPDEEPVRAVGCQCAAIVGESKGAHGSKFPTKSSNLLGARDLIKADGLAIAAHRQALTVGREGKREDRAPAAKIANLLAGVGFPESERAVASAGGDRLVVRRIGNGIDLITMPEANRAQPRDRAFRQRIAEQVALIRRLRERCFWHDDDRRE